jgi:hypothetical protein
MTTFSNVYEQQAEGKLSMVDRLIIRGSLTGLMPDGAMKRFLDSQSVLLKDFASYAKQASEQVVRHAKAIAEVAGRPYEYLAHAKTAATGEGKEDYARKIAERDGIEEGLVVVLSAVEPCSSLEVRGNRDTHRLEIARKDRKCLHVYFYYMDADFGLMHIRLQTWFPFGIQVYVNGREWMVRQLAADGVDFERYDNAIIHVAHLEKANALGQTFVHLDWPVLLNRFAEWVNPLLSTIEEAGFRSYYWSIHQCEVATDLLFPSRAALAELMPELYDAALRQFDARDVMRFLGRKPHACFTGEVVTELHERPEGRRVRHRVGRNSIKMYDKWSALRIETTFNNPRDIKVLRTVEKNGRSSHQWRPMAKGIANLYRYVEVGTAANNRYLQALTNVQLKSKSIAELDRLPRSHQVQGRHVAKLNPMGSRDVSLFRAILHGEHNLYGFRNRDISKALFPTPTLNPQLQKRRRAQISRRIATLRGHGLVARVPRSHLYRVTPKGLRAMGAAVILHDHALPVTMDTLRAVMDELEA